MISCDNVLRVKQLFEGAIKLKVFFMKNKKIIRETLHRIKLIFMRSIANTRLRKIAKIKTKSPIIKVGYIVQVAEIWDKAAPVFDAMLVDERFDPFLIVVPAYDFVKSEIKDYGEELAFFLDNYGNERIVRAYEHEKWLDLRSFSFDYIFFKGAGRVIFHFNIALVKLLNMQKHVIFLME